VTGYHDGYISPEPPSPVPARTAYPSAIECRRKSYELMHGKVTMGPSSSIVGYRNRGQLEEDIDELIEDQVEIATNSEMSNHDKVNSYQIIGYVESIIINGILQEITEEEISSEEITFDEVTSTQETVREILYNKKPQIERKLESEKSDTSESGVNDTKVFTG
jgi:hypothetical protein